MRYFVKKLLDKALEKENDALKTAYIEAEKYVDRQAVINDWQVLDIQDWE